MANLVLLSAGMTGRTHELKADKTTIGRVEDNAFQIPEPSVSSHHCEVVLRGNDIVVKYLPLIDRAREERLSSLIWKALDREEHETSRLITLDDLTTTAVPDLRR